jgi:hypothetical protein
LHSIVLAAAFGPWFWAHPIKRSLLLLFLVVLLTEAVLRFFLPQSKAAKAWMAFFARVSETWLLQFLAKFWTGVLLSIVYFVTLPFITAGQKLFGKDPLDRGLAQEPTFWRKHEPNPLGPKAAARHQF